MDIALNRRRGSKKTLTLLSIVGLLISVYGYYGLFTIVSAFNEIFSAFEATLSASSSFIMAFYKYFCLLSLVGVLPLVLIYLDKASNRAICSLVTINLLIMFTVYFLTENHLNKSILNMGIIQ